MMWTQREGGIMRAAGGAEEKKPEGPLEKGMERAEERAEKVKEVIAEKLEEAAPKVGKAGEKAVGRTANLERGAFSAISTPLKSGSEYIESIDVGARLDQVSETIRKKPGQALLIALGVGLALGFIIRRR